MENLLQYIWKFKLYNESHIYTTAGLPIEVKNPGLQGSESGAIFFNARVIVGNSELVGNVWIQPESSENGSSDNDSKIIQKTIVLQVVNKQSEPIFSSDGEPIPQLVLETDPTILQRIEGLIEGKSILPCRSHLRKFESTYIIEWLDALACERLERKTVAILSLYEKYHGDWNEVLYITLTRNFGFGQNGEAFEWLAKSLPYKHIQRQRGNSRAIEALLFGQAGLLRWKNEDAYYQLLQREYLFLRKKYGLKSVDLNLFKKTYSRAATYPAFRVAQLAAIWTYHDSIFSKIIEEDQVETLRDYFDVTPSAYWGTHQRFGYESLVEAQSTGKNIANVMLINTVAPILSAFGQIKKKSEFVTRAVQLLQSLPAEYNHIVSSFGRAGIRAQNAFDSQALIQLRREYCEVHRCLECRYGLRVITEIPKAKIDEISVTF